MALHAKSRFKTLPFLCEHPYPLRGIHKGYENRFAVLASHTGSDELSRVKSQTIEQEAFFAKTKYSLVDSIRAPLPLLKGQDQNQQLVRHKNNKAVGQSNCLMQNPNLGWEEGSIKPNRSNRPSTSILFPRKSLGKPPKASPSGMIIDIDTQTLDKYQMHCNDIMFFA